MRYTMVKALDMRRFDSGITPHYAGVVGTGVRQVLISFAPFTGIGCGAPPANQRLRYRLSLSNERVSRRKTRLLNRMDLGHSW
jgi:hypothetical protein